MLSCGGVEAQRHQLEQHQLCSVSSSCSWLLYCRGVESPRLTSPTHEKQGCGLLEPMPLTATSAGADACTSCSWVLYITSSSWGHSHRQMTASRSAAATGDYR
jgi:hypothetical protein